MGDMPNTALSAMTSCRYPRGTTTAQYEHAMLSIRFLLLPGSTVLEELVRW